MPRLLPALRRNGTAHRFLECTQDWYFKQAAHTVALDVQGGFFGWSRSCLTSPGGTKNVESTVAPDLSGTGAARVPTSYDPPLPASLFTDDVDDEDYYICYAITRPKYQAGCLHRSFEYTQGRSIKAGCSHGGVGCTQGPSIKVGCSHRGLNAHKAEVSK